MKRLAIVIGVLLAMVAFLVPSIPITAYGPLNAPRIHIKGSTSPNWAGYAVQYPDLYPNNQNNTVTEVKGSWTVPTVSSSPSGYSSVWVGIDGYSNNTVEQIGTEQDSNGNYYAWYEMYPKMSYEISNFPIAAGDNITAEVQYDTASGNFTLTITNDSNSDKTSNFFTTTQKNKRAQRSSAEWVVEAPSSGGVLPLADFGSVTFTGASFNDGFPINETGWQKDQMIMDNPNGGIATPSSLDNSGTSFTVTYSSSTPGTNTLNVGVSTDSPTYSTNSWVITTVTVEDSEQGSPIQGASVNITISYPDGSIGWSGTGTTNSTGTVQFRNRIKKGDPTGTYNVNARASFTGYQNGSGSTTFEVQ